MSEFILRGKSNEKIKKEALEMLYTTGRLHGLYFGRKSRANHNGIRGYITRWLKMNRLDKIENEFCEDCYQEVFSDLWAMSADKIVETIKVSPNKLIAIALVIVKRKCFSIKPNPSSSGIVWQMLNNSSHNNIQINTSEVLEDVDRGNIHSSVIVVDDEIVDEFSTKYGFTIEDIIERMSEDEKQFFYQQLRKQSVGKPSKELVKKREEFAIRMREIRIELENDR